MRLIVRENEKGFTLENFLREKAFSKRLIRIYKWQGEILVNGIKENVKRILQPGDAIDLILFETNFDVVPEEMNLDVCYEDEELLIVNKPPGLVVHPTKRYQSSTLANGIAAYFEKKGLKSLIRPINRLDKGTSGLVLFAKEPFMQYYLQIVKPMSKFYFAIVEGKMEGEGRIDLSIARKPQSGIERMVSKEGDRAITDYKVVKNSEKFSFLKVKIETGRTHQIRVHLSYIGHPIVGDTLYGSSDGYIKRHALHAYRVTFVHPLKEKSISIYSPLPEDIKNLLKLF
ncbi:MAG TPA: RluA family pseudouridine synthase [Clostridia bacterium]|nr:RluA family pseudouridine synthase [Clostridia bacterium]